MHGTTVRGQVRATGAHAVISGTSSIQLDLQQKTRRPTYTPDAPWDCQTDCREKARGGERGVNGAAYIPVPWSVTNNPIQQEMKRASPDVYIGHPIR